MRTSWPRALRQVADVLVLAAIMTVGSWLGLRHGNVQAAEVRPAQVTTVTVEQAVARVEAVATAMDPSCWSPAGASAARNGTARSALVTDVGGFRVRRVTVGAAWASVRSGTRDDDVRVVRLCRSRGA